MQNSGDAETVGGNTPTFRETYSEIVSTTERYMEYAQSTRQAFIRLLLTLSSGALLASMFLLRFPIRADTVWLTLLPVAWVFLGISVFACVLHFAGNHSYTWLGGALRIFIDEAEELTKELSLANQDKVVTALKMRLTQFDKDADLKWEHDQARVALSSFFLGLVTLVVFATRNLPWGP
jgi:hypothetical protein